MEKFDSAYSAVRPFVDTHGDNLALLRLLARIYTKLDMSEEALDAYRHLLFLSPKDAEARENVAKFEIGNASGATFDLDGIDSGPKGREQTDGWTELSLGDGASCSAPAKNSVTSPSTSTFKMTQDVTPVPTLTLAELYRDQRHPDKARAVLRRMLAASSSPSERREVENRLEALGTAAPKGSREARLLRFLEKIRQKGLEHSQKEC